MTKTRRPTGPAHKTDRVIKRRFGGANRAIHKQVHDPERKLTTHVVGARKREQSARAMRAGFYDPPSKTAMLEDLRRAVEQTASLQQGAD
jgi:hypothetical protein